MKTFAVLAASGTDRVGVVGEFTARLLDYSCNIEESKMAVLCGEFAMILLVSGEESGLETLLNDIATAPIMDGLQVSGKRTSAHAATPGGRPYRIDCISLDTPGIVHAVAVLLRSRGINIDELETETSGAPFTGAPMFQVHMSVIVPPDVSIGQLRRELADIGEEHDLDISVRAITGTTDE